jgi:pimeloyl-ACP methyl ester carboxylesterase
MARSLTAALSAMAALMLSSCITVRVDEGSVFAPTRFNAKQAAETGETLRGEGILKGASADWTWSVGYPGDRRELKGDPATHAPTAIVHGRMPAEKGGIAWSLLTREGEGRPLVVFCGGNASTRQNSGFLYSAIALRHADVLLFDYPGSGETGGTASPASFDQMATQALPELIRANWDGKQKLVAWGHSLGGFVCSRLAGEIPGFSGAILYATARNAEEVAAAWKPGWLGPLVRVSVEPSLAAHDNADLMKAFEGPILVLGAEKDRTLPFELAESFAAALQERQRKVTFVPVNAGHSTLAVDPVFTNAVDGFFAALGR